MITSFVLNGNKYDVGNQLIEYEGRELEEYTWSDLTNINNFSNFKVGDYKTINVGSEQVRMQIAGIDTYYNSGSSINIIPHHIDWISIDCINNQMAWSNSTSNNGTQSIQNPFMASNVKQQLDQIYNNMPEVSSFIIDKYMLMETRYSSNIITYSNGKNWVNLGKLWLPTEYEVYGSRIWGTKRFSEGLAIQYPLFTNNGKALLKGRRGGPSGWWLATVSDGDSTSCCAIDTTGNIGKTLIKINTYGVPICFRTGVS